MAEQKSSAGGGGVVRKTMTRSDVRQATLRGLSRTKADPRSVRITSGQRRHIARSK